MKAPTTHDFACLIGIDWADAYSAQNDRSLRLKLIAFPSYAS
jgi:hypothetical protein